MDRVRGAKYPILIYGFTHTSFPPARLKFLFPFSQLVRQLCSVARQANPPSLAWLLFILFHDLATQCDLKPRPRHLHPPCVLENLWGIRWLQVLWCSLRLIERMQAPISVSMCFFSTPLSQTQ